MNTSNGVGIALFNDPQPTNKRNLAGVYCVAGREPVRFTEQNALPAHMRWLTNLNSEAIKPTAPILSPYFATTTVDQLKKELGLTMMPIEHQAYFLSIALNNITQITHNIYGASHTPLTALHDMMPNELRKANPIPHSEFKAVLARSDTTHHTLHAKAHVKSALLCLVLPRYQHALNMLKDGLPLCDWVKMENAEMGPKPKRMDWVLSEVRPTVCLVRIAQVKVALQGVVDAAFTEQFVADGSTQGVYVTTPELVFLNEVAQVTIEEVYIASSRLTTKIKLPLTDSLARMSWAYGIVCENYCNALRKGIDGTVTRTFHSFWLQAQDRLHCLEKVVALMKRGYVIRGFGMGKILIALEPHMNEAFYRDCVDLAIVPPMTQDPVTISWSEKPTSVDLSVQLFLQSNVQPLFVLDRQLIDRDAF